MTTEAEAIARLREAVRHVDTLTRQPNVVVPAGVEDLRALLDAHATLETAHEEALDALQALRASYIADGGDRGDEGLCRATAVLAKAGRR